jgi:hypothetical protein
MDGLMGFKMGPECAAGGRHFFCHGGNILFAAFFVEQQNGFICGNQVLRGVFFVINSAGLKIINATKQKTSYFCHSNLYRVVSLQKTESKKVIGRLEKIDLPELSLYNLDAKIDTGAYTSSLHSHKISVEKKEGKLWAEFHVLDPGHPEYEGKLFRCPVHKIKNWFHKTLFTYVHLRSQG